MVMFSYLALLLFASSSSANCFFPEPASVDFVLCPRSLVLVNLLSLQSLLLLAAPPRRRSTHRHVVVVI